MWSGSGGGWCRVVVEGNCMEGHEREGIASDWAEHTTVQ